MTEIESDIRDDESFEDWLERKKEEARDAYKGGGPRSDDPRGTDISLGKFRAYKDAYHTFLIQKHETESEQTNE